MNTDSLRYAGFGPRCASIILDFIVLLPVMVFFNWGSATSRLFNFYNFIPGILFGLFFSVYLVRRFGGTPGKLIVGIRICKLNGEPVGYREAFLRNMPDLVFGILASAALMISISHMGDSEYLSLSHTERAKRMVELAPSWYKPLQVIQTAWIWSELVVLLTNRKRRALHDFIAGTVVIYKAKSPNKVS